jgi:arylsulfatase A-like enzyme
VLDAANAKAGRTQDGVSLLPAVRDTRKTPDRAIEIEAPHPLFDDPSIPQNAWDRPYKGVRTDRYTYVVYTEAGDEELYDRSKDPNELRSVAGDPAYAKVKASLKAKLAKLDKCKGSTCAVKP